MPLKQPQSEARSSRRPAAQVPGYKTCSSAFALRLLGDYKGSLDKHGDPYAGAEHVVPWKLGQIMPWDQYSSEYHAAWNP